MNLIMRNGLMENYIWQDGDIKTKILFLQGNPKAYNIDKLLEFLSKDKSVYLIYLVGIDGKGKIVARLIPAFDTRLLGATNIIHHWAGRNSRGVAQFEGHALCEILKTSENLFVDCDKIKDFVYELIEK